MEARVTLPNDTIFLMLLVIIHFDTYRRHCGGVPVRAPRQKQLAGHNNIMQRLSLSHEYFPILCATFG